MQRSILKDVTVDAVKRRSTPRPLSRSQLLIFGMRFVVCTLIAGNISSGQSPKTSGKNTTAPIQNAQARKTAPKKTFIDIELLQTSDGGGLFAQNWLKAMEPFDVTLHIRRPNSGEKSELKERIIGSTRYVTVVGTLDRFGKITFSDRTFVLADSVKVKEWVEELRTFGAQGDPADKPLWGLTKDQFAAVFDGLTATIDFETNDLLLATLLAKVPFPKNLPLHKTAEAIDLIAARGDRAKLKHEMKGFSIGTVLAIALNENGLGFRPSRTPSGEIEILIEPRNAKQNQWPVGWPVKTQTSKALPKLYVMVPIELSDVDLSDVIDAISTLSETPIFIDRAELETKQIELDKIKVNFPRKITTWSLALNKLVVPQRLTREFWQDEAGHVFIWITTSHAGRSKDSNKSEP